MSKIEWTQKTWNPIVGCSKVSGGCKNCYAIGMAWRLMHIGHSKEKYAGTVEKTANGQLNWTGKVNLSEKDLLKPITWKNPQMIFVNSESDLFHESIPFEFIDKVFAVMALCTQHIFQVLTKRPARMVEYFSRFNYRERIMTQLDLIGDQHDLYDQCRNTITSIRFAHEPVFPNVWLGVSVENQKTADERIPLLLKVPAAIRFLSCEPLLGPVDLTAIPQTVSPGYFGDCLQPYHVPRCDKEIPYPKIDWCIVGGESGKDARPMHPEWSRSLRDQCQKAGVAFFFKQWGQWENIEVMNGATHTLLVDGNLLDGIIWGEPGIYDNRAFMKRSGKKAAGRMLDNKEWNEMPNQKPQHEPAEDPDFFVGGFD